MCAINMEYIAPTILKRLEGLLKWCPQDKDTALYQEIRVLIRYYKIKSMEE